MSFQDVKYDSRKCKWCGTEFIPTSRKNVFCCRKCMKKWHYEDVRKIKTAEKPKSNTEQIADIAKGHGMSIGNMRQCCTQGGEGMVEINVGDVICIMAESRTELGNGTHYKVKPINFKVLEVYEHHVLCQNLETGIRESFTWLELKKNIVKGEKE